MIEHPSPSWPPLSQLPRVAALLDGLWEVAEQQRTLLEEAQRQSYALPADTVEGVVADVTALHERVRMVAHQLRRWEVQDLTATERHEVARTGAQLERLRQVGRSAARSWRWPTTNGTLYTPSGTPQRPGPSASDRESAFSVAPGACVSRARSSCRATSPTPCPPCVNNRHTPPRGRKKAAGPLGRSLLRSAP